MNVSPTLFFSLLMLSIMRTTSVDPVGIVQAVFAAFAEVGCVTRSVLDRNRGPSPAFGCGVAAAAAGAVDVELVDRVAG
jgi:hypothetical protein